MDKLIWSVMVIVLLVFSILMVMGLMLLKKGNPSFEMEEDLGIGHISLNSEDLRYLVGKEGITVTELKPWGTCKIDGVEFAVKAEEEFLDKDVKISVCRIQGSRIIVREQEKRRGV